MLVKSKPFRLAKGSAFAEWWLKIPQYLNSLHCNLVVNKEQVGNRSQVLKNMQSGVRTSQFAFGVKRTLYIFITANPDCSKIIGEWLHFILFVSVNKNCLLSHRWHPNSSSFFSVHLSKVNSLPNVEKMRFSITCVFGRPHLTPGFLKCHV